MGLPLAWSLCGAALEHRVFSGLVFPSKLGLSCGTHLQHLVKSRRVCGHQHQVRGLEGWGEQGGFLLWNLPLRHWNSPRTCHTSSWTPGTKKEFARRMRVPVQKWRKLQKQVWKESDTDAPRLLTASTNQGSPRFCRCSLGHVATSNRKQPRWASGEGVYWWEGNSTVA